MPKGYIIGEIEITNPAGYPEYRRHVPDISIGRVLGVTGHEPT